MMTKTIVRNCILYKILPIILMVCNYDYFLSFFTEYELTPIRALFDILSLAALLFYLIFLQISLIKEWWEKLPE